MTTKGEILIVDDSTASLRLLADILTVEKYTVRPTQDPKLAIESALNDPPDLILLDVKMPGMNGFEVCEQLKQDTRTEEIPIIFVSVLEGVEDRVRGFALGGVDFLSKPVQREEVLARVATHLDLYQSHRALQEETKRLRLALSAAGEGVWDWDIPGDQLYLSPLYQNLHDLKKEEEVGSFKELCKLIHPEDVPELEQALQNHWQNDDRPYKIEHRSRNSDGSWGWLEAKGQLISRTRDGAPERMVGIFTDITKRKELEQQLKQQTRHLSSELHGKEKELAIVADRLMRKDKLAVIGQISASIAHELRNPLSSIKQAAYFLQRITKDDTKKEVGEFLQLITDEVDDANKVITDLMDMTRMKEPQRLTINLGILFAETIKRMTIPETITINLECSPDPFLLQADELQLRQVMINLLSNAIHACNERQGTISVTAREDREKNKAILAIKDDGIGMKESIKSHVFEPLFTTKAKGTGLGLTICRQIIERHGGNITADSSPESGTVITFTLNQK